MKQKTITKADYSKFQHDAYWGEEPYPDLVEKWINLVAKDCNLDKNRVKIWYCHPVEEYCIYVDKKWVGYFDVNNYFSGVIGVVMISMKTVREKCMKDKELLQWIHDRFVIVYEENRNVDFLRALRAIIKRTDEDKQSSLIGVCDCENKPKDNKDKK